MPWRRGGQLRHRRRQPLAQRLRRLFYNNGNGVGLWAQSTNGNAIKAEGENAVSVLATNTNSPAVWGVSTNDAGIHGASGSAPGVEGFSITGPGVYGESVSGVAIAANGAITSTAPTYLWISGNDVVRYNQNDTTMINMMSNGGASSSKRVKAGIKYVVLPVTIAGTLYGQNVRVAAVDIYWQGETDREGCWICACGDKPAPAGTATCRYLRCGRLYVRLAQ